MLSCNSSLFLCTCFYQYQEITSLIDFLCWAKYIFFEFGGQLIFRSYASFLSNGLNGVSRSQILRFTEFCVSLPNLLFRHVSFQSALWKGNKASHCHLYQFADMVIYEWKFISMTDYSDWALNKKFCFKLLMCFKLFKQIRQLLLLQKWGGVWYDIFNLFVRSILR